MIDRKAEGRNGGRFSRLKAEIGFAVILSILPSFRPSAGLFAQVGYDPGRSPFRDLPHGGAILLGLGYLGGSRGRVGVGMSDGPAWSLRYERSLGGATAFSFSLTYAQTTRFVVDPTKDSLSRQSGPFDTDVVLSDIGLQLLLTGGKTWHGLAPYLGTSLGLAYGGGSPPDSSGYDFGSKVTLAPEVGVRWYPARRLSVRAEFRAVYWRLRYPLSYKVPFPVGCTTDCQRVLPLTASQTEWTAHPWISASLGWTF